MGDRTQRAGERKSNWAAADDHDVAFLVGCGGEQAFVA